MTQPPNDFHDPLDPQQQDPMLTDSLEPKDPSGWAGYKSAFRSLSALDIAIGVLVLLCMVLSPVNEARYYVGIVLIALVAAKVIMAIGRNDKIHGLFKVILVGGVVAVSGVAMFVALIFGKLVSPGGWGTSGRPFRRQGRALTAQVALGAGWELPEAPALAPKLAAAPLPTAPPVEPQLDLPDDLQQALAQVYCEEARAEHASIAAFSHLSLQLLALGAPPALLNSTHHAALDEVRHARTFFALASTYSKTPVGAGLFPQALLPPPAWPTDRAAQLVRLAQESVLDGCLGEGVAAALLAEGSRCAADPGLSALLATVAGDEQRHTELAWDIVTWALAEGGTLVAEALQQTLPRLPEVAPRPSKPPIGSALLWQAHGKVFGEKAQHLYTQTQQSVAARLTTLLSPYTADAYRQAA